LRPHRLALARGSRLQFVLHGTRRDGIISKLEEERRAAAKRRSSIMADAKEPSPLEQLKESLDVHSARVMDLFRKWDINGDGLVDKREFRAGLEHLGFGSLSLHGDELFDTFDEDLTGSITFRELNRVLRKVKPVEAKAKPVGDKARVSDVDDVRKEVTNWVLQMAADSSIIY